MKPIPKRGARRRTAMLLTAALAASSALVAAIPSPSVSAAGDVVFDDLEHGDPFGNGWFQYNDGVGGGGMGANGDVPPGGGAFSLETGWGSGGNPGVFGGFGRTSLTDLTGTDTFNFWINPTIAGQDFTLEINLQEDDNSNNAIDPPDDDEFQYNCVVSDTGPCAVAGGGWQLVSIPLADFFDDNSFLFGGNGVLDADPGNGLLVNVAVVVLSNSGADVNFRTDDWIFSAGAYVPTTTIDDFESGLPFGNDGDGAPLGFYTFQGAGSSISIATTDTPPAAVPDADPGNDVLMMDTESTSFAGYIHAFENGAVDTWVPQDWSTSEGIRFWMYGAGSGTQMFIDILDNRNPGSTSDDAERFTVPFLDDVAGWRLLEFPFTDFVRKEISNQAPNDGLGLFEMHGYALGVLNTGGAQTYYFDDVELYGVGEPPPIAVNFSQQNTFITEGTTGDVGVKLNRPLGPDDPAQVSIDYATERSNAVPFEEFTPTSGTLTFVNGGPSELFFPVETFDDTKFEGDEQIVIRLTNPVDTERGALFQGSVLIDDDDPFDPLLLADFEQGDYLWDTAGSATLDAVRTTSGSGDARPDQDAVEYVGRSEVPLHVELDVRGEICRTGSGGIWQDFFRSFFSLVPVHLLSTEYFDATTVDPSTVRFGGAADVRFGRWGSKRVTIRDVDGDGRDDVVFVFREHKIGCDGPAYLNGQTFDGREITTGGSDAALVRDLPLGQDWSGTESLTFWYDGDGQGDQITVTLKDNRAPDPGPGGWSLAWADEFDDPAGTPPNPANWTYEIGDTTPDGKNGWGNEELQYYTDDPANAQTDGNGNLKITLDAADGSQECYYGPCEFESARLITQNRAEFAYGRIESRLQVPTGGDGLWPAFWSLGTDITYNPWPDAGEIDIMEYVSRIPNEIFGTIHGPGYNGGDSFSGVWGFGERVDLNYHTYAVEWEPNEIRWYIDGILYHQAEPSDVPGPWVFEKPFFLLLNFAIGGNFGGAIDPANTYPQEYLVDYVRVYQGPDTAERFEATFIDDTEGWSQITVPVTDFVRSADQPAGAPDDGLGLDEVWGVGLAFPSGTTSGEVGFDLVERALIPPPTELTVTTDADDGPGSLREALALIAEGGTITIDPSLAGQTVTLTSGELVAGRSVTIDGPDSAPLTISGGNASRVLQVVAGAVVSIDDVTITDGAAAPQGGGILNYGELTLTDVTVTGNTEASPGGPTFDHGGGGIYNGEGATLNLVDSEVSDNTSLNNPAGGIHGMFNSTINIINSTVSGNTSGDVAGGVRSLGTTTITGSTISGNTATAWHGAGIFATNGTVTIEGSSIVDNTAGTGLAGGIMVATFGDPVLVTVQDSVLTGNVEKNCQVEGNPAVAVLTLLGGNTIDDGSCAPPP